MQQCQGWPPPDWNECIITWSWLLSNLPDEAPSIHEIYAWCDQFSSNSRYHVHGWQSTEGFAFRFEDPKDAVVFKLRWG